MDRLSTADLRVAAQIEAADAANALHMAAQSSPLVWESIAGGTALFAGPDSPLTRALGLGMAGPVQTSELERLESFFFSRGSPATIELCPLADASLLAFLQNRSYRFIDSSAILATPVPSASSPVMDEELELVDRGNIGRWARIVSEGFSQGAPLTSAMVDALAATCRDAQCWLALGVAGGAMRVEGGIAIFLGDATQPDQRRRGLQTRLIAAAAQGCRLAIVSVAPGSASHKNYERSGFQLLYVRTTLRRDVAAELA